MKEKKGGTKQGNRTEDNVGEVLSNRKKKAEALEKVTKDSVFAIK